MSRQRYEPVAQRDETIILDNIHNSPHYNYNSGIPNSVASSHYTPSLIAPSIPSSPPPSFHTISSPGTPRPTPSTSTHHSHHSHPSSAPSYAELWGVAPSTAGGDTNTTIGTSNDALATITGLKQRIEWLEESIGRLLLEKDQAARAAAAANGGEGGEGAEVRKERDNCCVTFTDASPDLERALTSGKGTNCCVTFTSKSDKRNIRKGPVLLFALLIVICVMITIISVANATRGQAFPPVGDELVNGNQS